MAPRVLVCIEDKGVAHVVVARLMRDGLEGIVIDHPSHLVAEAKRDAAAVCVQDRYPSGEAATSLLRQIRVARTEPVPAVVVCTTEMAQGDRHVLSRQYRVGTFCAADASPVEIALGLRQAAGILDDEGDTQLHGKNRTGLELSLMSLGSRDDSDESEMKTVEVKKADLEAMRRAKSEEADGSVDLRLFMNELSSDNMSQAARDRQSLDMDDPPTLADRGDRFRTRLNDGVLRPPNAAADNVVDKSQTQATERPVFGADDAASPASDPAASVFLAKDALSELPIPGGEIDVDLGARTFDDVRKNPAAEPVTARRVGISPAAPAMPSPAVSSPASDAEDPVQIQELQKAQAELKAALAKEKKATADARRRVEELEARVAGDGRMPMRGVPSDGVFEEIRYPALLARCRADAFTGAIAMQSGAATRLVYLRDGLPVAFHSSEPGERIGKVLVTLGRISEGQYGAATVRSVERSIKLTDALVELGYLDAETIAVEQRNLTRDQIIQSFELVQGRFAVQPGTTPDAQTATFDFGPGEIYLQGFRRYAPAHEMAAVYETLRDKYLTATTRLAAYRPKLGLVGEDERLLRLLGEALTVEEAVDRAQVTADQAARLLAALQALDLVEEWSPGVEQFRTRLRHERQRHAEEIAQLLQDAKKREDRLIETFETAIKRLDKVSSTSSTATSAVSNSSASTATIAFATKVEKQAERPVEKAVERGVERREEPHNAFATAEPRNNSIAPAMAANAAASHAAASSAVAAPPAQASAFGVGNHNITNNFASSAPATSNPTAPPRAVTTAAMSGVGDAKGEGRAETQKPLSVADAKFKEGVEQAAQSKLDEAEVTLREAVRLDASKPEYLTALARVLLANPRYERAGTLPVVKSLLDRAVQIAPDFQEAVTLHQQVLRELAG